MQSSIVRKILKKTINQFETPKKDKAARDNIRVLSSDDKVEQMQTEFDDKHNKSNSGPTNYYGRGFTGYI